MKSKRFQFFLGFTFAVFSLYVNAAWQPTIESQEGVLIEPLSQEQEEFLQELLDSENIKSQMQRRYQVERDLERALVRRGREVSREKLFDPKEVERQKRLMQFDRVIRNL